MTRTAPGWPAPDEDAMRHLLDRGVGCVGTDAPSMGSSHAGAAVHLVGLGAEVAFVEALANLVAHAAIWLTPFEALPDALERVGDAFAAESSGTFAVTASCAASSAGRPAMGTVEDEVSGQCRRTAGQAAGIAVVTDRTLVSWVK